MIFNRFTLLDLLDTFVAEEVNGSELIDNIIQLLLPVQHEIGGRIVYLECDKSKPKLIQFYEKNNFVPFKDRIDNNDGVTYVQMLRIISC